MAKTDETLKLEMEIWETTHKQGVFCCFEVTIGWFGNERVDYLTYDTKGIFRCYEIKVSKSDFNSKAKKTFVGHYNYYVMPKSLYDEVKDVIPVHVGVYCDKTCVKKAKKQEPTVGIDILKDSLLRSLSREVEKQIASRSTPIINSYKAQIKYYKKRADEYYQEYWKLRREAEERFGRRWRDL